MSFVIGIDTGGTFTDGFIASNSGLIESAKSHSTPPDFSRGVVQVVRELASAVNMSPEEMLGQTEHIIHGTTSTLNAVITGDVPRVGFITTRGHGDSISMMNLEGRYAGLGPHQIQNMSRTNKPPPLVPRERIEEINERIDHKGAVLVRIDESGVRAAVRRLLGQGVESIAVSLLWSFRNPSHERRVRDIIHEEAPGMFVALSHEVSPRLREYSRSATTIVNTQVGPVLKNYLTPLEQQLRQMGFQGALLIMQGSGGCVKASNAPAHAVSTLGSVLTGGIVGCLHLGDALHHKNIISTDMGGTTFLVGLVVDGKPLTTTTMVLRQHQINVPMVDVHTIGAGGGAIASIDGGGNLRVGPRSAGARPGPACYGDGGTEPTVTDADLVLGIVNPDNFLGGRKKLRRELAEQAIEAKIAKPLGLSVEDAAAAIYAIQNAQTADLVRRVVINSGFDPRDFALYAFGGAGPMHAASYSADLGISEVVFPLGSTAAVFSAYGLAASDILLTAELSQPANFPVEPEAMNGAFAKLEADLAARLASQGLQMSKVDYVREADVRYTSQITEIPTPVPNKPLAASDVAEIGSTFAALYERIFGVGTGYQDAGLQVITYRVRAIGALPIRPALPDLQLPRAPAKPVNVRQVMLDTRKGRQATKIYDSRQLATGSEIHGPAVIEAPTTTVAVPEGSSGVVDRLGNFVLRYTGIV